MTTPDNKTLRAIAAELKGKTEHSLTEQQFAELKRRWLAAGGTEDGWVAVTDQMPEM